MEKKVLARAGNNKAARESNNVLPHETPTEMIPVKERPKNKKQKTRVSHKEENNLNNKSRTHTMVAFSGKTPPLTLSF